MPIGLCVRCMKPTPDSFHDFKEICSCISKEQWIRKSKKMKWMIKIDGILYNFYKS